MFDTCGNYYNTRCARRVIEMTLLRPAPDQRLSDTVGTQIQTVGQHSKLHRVLKKRSVIINYTIEIVVRIRVPT